MKAEEEEDAISQNQDGGLGAGQVFEEAENGCILFFLNLTQHFMNS